VLDGLASLTQHTLLENTLKVVDKTRVVASEKERNRLCFFKLLAASVVIHANTAEEEETRHRW
jgi:hypothetical protein